MIFKQKHLLSIFCSICILLFYVESLKAQLITGAGGTGLRQEVWLMADDLIDQGLTSDSEVTVWTDKSPNAFTFQKSSTAAVKVPVFSTENTKNFHPSVSFNTDRQYSRLVSSTNFTIEANKGYYSFFVVDGDLGSMATYSSVFSFNGTNNYDWVGIYKTGDLLSPYNRGGNANRALRGNEANQLESAAIYGIFNGNSTTVSSYGFYNNYLTAGASFAMRTALARPLVVGHSVATGTGANYSFLGDLYEVIVLSTDGVAAIDETNVLKVNTYLSLKYGIPLDFATKLIASDATEIWSNIENPNYSKNIFGLGRDDQSGLFVNQSHSNKSSNFTVFVGDQLYEYSKENQTDYFNDKEFILFGTNAKDGFVDYLYGPGATFQQGTITEDINFREARVFKAKLTGRKSHTVKVKTGGTYLLVSSDENFSPVNTRLYTVVDRVASDVLINDGDYITNATFEVAPGGVINGLRVWLKADDKESLKFDANNGVIEWADQTVNGNNFSLADVSYNGKKAPEYIASDERMNFFPALFFNSDAYLAIKAGPMSTNAPTDFTSFVVYHATDYASTVRLYTHGFGSVNPRASSTRLPGMGFAPGEGVGRIVNNGGGQSYIDGKNPGFTKNSTALHMINTHKAGGVSGSGYVIHDFGGWQDNVNTTGNFGDGFRMAGGATLGGASLAESTFQGLIAEVFFYERALTQDEQDKIRTYLSIKYAITLADAGNGVNYDYKLTEGTFIWPGNSQPNINYHTNVAGLSRDDGSGLFTNKSKSSAANATITMETSRYGDLPDNVSHLVNNNSALYWGNDGLTGEISFKDNADICSEAEFRLARTWLVDKTNLTEQTVKISLGQSDVFPYASSSYQAFLLIASSQEDLDNNNWSQVIPTYFIDGEHQAEYTFRDKYTYFTIGVKALGGACEICDFRAVKKIEFTNGTWPGGTTEKLFDLGDGFIVNVKTSIASGASFYSRYPRSSTSKSLNEYRKGKSEPLMTTEISLSIAAVANFQIFEIDKEGNRFDDVEIYGMCGDAKVVPKLSYVDTEKRSTYTISGNIASAKATAGYTSKNAKMNVEFPYPVEKIYIEQKASTGTSGLQRIGISPIELSCPTPLPPLNEEGLVMTSEGPESVLLCDEVPYTFRIYNSNCATKSVNFSDILPLGMVWVKNSMSVSDLAIGDYTQINEYGLSRELKIDSLMLPGGETLIIKAIAIFEDDASGGIYTNQPIISYPKIDNDVERVVELMSCDRWSTDCLPTETQGIEVLNRPKRIELLKAAPKNSCYREGGDVIVTLKFENPNPAITGVTMMLQYNEEFAYLEGSLQSTTITKLGTVTMDDGLFIVEGFEILNGDNDLIFRLKSPQRSALVQAVDDDGAPIFNSDNKPEIVPLDIAFDMFVDSAEDCAETVFINMNDMISVPYCLSKSYVVSNKMATQRIKKK